MKWRRGYLVDQVKEMQTMIKEKSNNVLKKYTLESICKSLQERLLKFIEGDWESFEKITFGVSGDLDSGMLCKFIYEYLPSFREKCVPIFVKTRF